MSGQLDDVKSVKDACKLLLEAGHSITHDWTESDVFLSSKEAKLANKEEAGLRAKKDLDGVISSDVYILLSNNKEAGKGMYVELGAALALREKTGKPEVYIVGEMNHMSVFYLHPSVKSRSSIVEVINELS